MNKNGHWEIEIWEMILRPKGRGISCHPELACPPLEGFGIQTGFLPFGQRPIRLWRTQE